MSHLDDRLNPLLLRELRRLVRNRFITVLINLFIAVLVFVCVFMVLLIDRPIKHVAGSDLFIGLAVVMTFACFLMVVVYTAVTTASERINADLMFISALKPSQIVLGKFFSGVILSFLLMSITFPFVTLAYLLGGLDIRMVIFSFAWTFLAIQTMNSFIIFTFSNVKNYGQMFGTAFGVGIACMYGIGGIIGMLVDVSFRWTSASADIVLAPFLLLLAALCLFLAAAVAVVAPPTANRLLPVRIVVTTVFLLTLAYCGFEFGGNPDVFKGWAYFWLFVLSLILLLTVGEREKWAYRVKKTIPNNFLFRMLVFPFYTGSPCGLAWVFLLGGIFLFAVLGANLLGDDNWAWPFVLLFAFNYAVSALLLRSFVFPKVVSPGIPGFACILLMLTTFGSMLVFYLITGDFSNDFGDQYSSHVLSALNPFLLADGFEQTYRILAATGWAALLAFPFIFWFGLRVREFSPSTPSDVMTLEDAIAIVKHVEEMPMPKEKRNTPRHTDFEELRDRSKPNDT